MIVPELLQPRPAAEKRDPDEMIRLANAIDPWKIEKSVWQDLIATAPRWALPKTCDQYRFDPFTDALIDSQDKIDRKLGTRNKLRHEMLTAMGCPMDLTGTIVLHRWSQAWELVQATTRQALNFWFHSEDQQILMASDEDVRACKVEIETDPFDDMTEDQQQEFLHLCFKIWEPYL